MIKNIFCKIGYHRYKMTHRALTCSIMTTVRCEVCGHVLTAEDPSIEREKRRKKISKHKFNKESND